MKDEIIHLKPEEALDLLVYNSDGTVHTQVQSGMMFLGADHSIESLKETLAEADDIQIGGENCQAMGHGIVVFRKGAQYHKDLLFVAHDAEKVKAYEDANVPKTTP